jgi:hypothetical protein
VTAAASIIGIAVAVGALILAVSSFRSHRLNFSQGLRMAFVWVAIFLCLVLVFRQFGV